MTDKHRRRGSVILLVVGLLTILAMLGSALLISSHLNAKQSSALAQQASTEPIAAGIVKQIQTILKRDLHLDTNNAYGNVQTTTNTPWPMGVDIDNDSTIDNIAWTDINTNPEYIWKTYIDLPAGKFPLPPPVTRTDSERVDPWLADCWLASDDLTQPAANEWSYTYLSDITGELEPEQGRNPEFYQISPDTNPDDPWYLRTTTGSFEDIRPVDTDGDRIPDALLLDSGVTNAQGQKYYFAVRVTDLSGKLCVNTAGARGFAAPPAIPAPMSPADVDLEWYLDGTSGGIGVSYTALDTARSPDTDPTDPDDLQDFYYEAACQLLAPDGTVSGNNYLPFSIGEEMYFRWLGDYALAGTRGRLAGVLDRVALQNQLPLLTTYNCSRAIPRVPSANVSDRLNLIDQTILDSDDNRQFLYAQLVAAGAGNEEAAHFVANLWAYQRGSDLTEAYAFQPNGPAFKVFGLQPDLRITEAFASHGVNTANDPTNDDYFYAYAIEVTNFSGQGINLNQYQIAPDGGRAVTLPNYTLASGAKAVLYSYGKGLNCILTIPDLFSDGTGPATIGANWFYENSEVPARRLPIDFSNDAVIGIYRTTVDGLVPVDKVSAADLNDYTCTNKTDPATDELENSRRDDDPARGRYNVADYKELNNPLPGPSLPFTKDNELGNPNTEVAAIDNIGSDFTVSIYQSSTGAVADLAELSDIFLTGPIDTTGAGRFEKLMPFTTQIKPFDDADPRMGRMNLRPSSVTTVSDYPEVPWPMILPELVETLDTDTARDPANPMRVYGKININSATREVLRQLPWPMDIDTTGDGAVDTVITAADIEEALDYIIAYRDRIQIGGSPDYSSGRGDGTSTHPTITYRKPISGLRTNSDIDGYLTPGEVAIPLGDYVINNLMAIPGTPEDNEYYQSIRDSFYAPISNLVTVNSDVFAVNIRVDLYDADETPEETDTTTNEFIHSPQHTWYYIAVIDRSNCTDDTQTPAVLLFSEVK